MNTLSGGVTLSSSFLCSFSTEVNPEKKEFAPSGANSSLSELTLVWKCFTILGNKQEVMKVLALCKGEGEKMEVYLFTFKVLFLSRIGS